MKLVLILRGVSGCGKTTEARRWAARASTPAIVSADQYMDPAFDHKKLEACHNSCFFDFEVALSRGHDLVIVDNTNTKISDIRRYVEAARERMYEVIILQINVDPSVAFKRSVHNAPLETIRHQAARLWHERIPDDWEIWHRGRPWAPPRPVKKVPTSGVRPARFVPKPKGFLPPPNRGPQVEYRRVKASSGG